MDNCRGDKKPPLSTYQQSFRIDDLLTHKAIEQQQQPDHYSMYPSTKIESNNGILNLTTRTHDDMVSGPCSGGYCISILLLFQISDGTEMCEHGRGTYITDKFRAFEHMI